MDGGPLSARATVKMVFLAFIVMSFTQEFFYRNVKQYYCFYIQVQWQEKAACFNSKKSYRDIQFMILRVSDDGWIWVEALLISIGHQKCLQGILFTQTLSRAASNHDFLIFIYFCYFCYHRDASSFLHLAHHLKHQEHKKDRYLANRVIPTISVKKCTLLLHRGKQAPDHCRLDYFIVTFSHHHGSLSLKSVHF